MGSLGLQLFLCLLELGFFWLRVLGKMNLELLNRMGFFARVGFLAPSKTATLNPKPYIP